MSIGNKAFQTMWNIYIFETLFQVNHWPVMSCCKQRQRLQPARELHALPLVGSGEKTGGFVPWLNFILFFHCLDCYSVFFFLSLFRYVGQRCKSWSSSQRGRGTSARDSRFFTSWKWVRETLRGGEGLGPELEE